MKRKEQKSKKNGGITLVALVITIIVLLILAGITLNLTLGENGILKMADKAVNNYTEAQEKELTDLENLYSQIRISGDTKVTLTTEELNEYINKKVDEKLSESLEYKPGDKIKFLQLFATGCLTNSRKEISFSINLGKPISKKVTKIEYKRKF